MAKRRDLTESMLEILQTQRSEVIASLMEVDYSDKQALLHQHRRLAAIEELIRREQ